MVRRQRSAMYVPKIAALTSVMTLALAGVVAVAPGAQAACGSGTYGGGSGTSGDPYVIATPTHLDELRTTSGDWSCSFSQTESIDMNGATWSSGSVGSSAVEFSGTYDGNGHTISGLTVSGSSYVGLFGLVTGTIREVSFSGTVSGTDGFIGGIVGYLSSGTVDSSTMTGSVSATTGNGINVGGIAGTALAATITDSHSSATISVEEGNAGGVVGFLSASDLSGASFSGSVTASVDVVGGLVGYFGGLPGSLLSDSYSTGTVKGRDMVGGAVGRALSGSIDRVYSTGNVTGTDVGSTYVGGLVGLNSSDIGARLGGATIADCYARGAVVGNNVVGGLVGWTDALISRSYATGAVTANGSDGGLIGIAGPSAVASFWDTETTGESSSAGGSGKATSQMTSLSTFYDASWSIAQGYDPTKTWGIDPDINNGYPYLISLSSGSPSLSANPATYEFTFWLDSGEQCTDISPQVVQRGEAFTLPGTLAGCRRDGTEIVGWTIPWGDRVFAPGTVVRVVDSQQFTAVLKEPSVRVEYDANVAADDSCRSDGVEIAVDDRTRTQTLMRDAMSGWPLASTAPCVPDGVVLQRWNTAGDGSGITYELRAPVPVEWIDDPQNVRRLYAVWGR